MKTPFLHLGLLASVFTANVWASASDGYEKYSTEFLAPKDVWAVNFNFNRGSISSEFDSDGNQKSLSDRLARQLNSSTLPQLAQLEQSLGVPANLGTVGGSLRFETKFVEITAGYGLTDDLSLGFRLPIGESCSEANVQLSGATWGINPVFGNPAAGALAQAPFIPVATPLPAGASVTPFSTAELQSFLINPANGFAYTDVDSHCESGLMGPVFGASWRLHNGEYDSLIFLPGVRLGRLTDKHDPDVLFQPVIDDGSTDLILRTDYYRDLRNNLDLTVQFEYNLQFEDKRTLRTGPLALASTKERFKRDLGDFFILDIELGYRFWNDQLRVYGAYYQKNKGKDDYRSTRGTDVTLLERGTTFIDHEVRAGIYFDGVPAWRAGKLPLPLRLDLNYWESTGGKNALKYHFTEFHVTFAF